MHRFMKHRSARPHWVWLLFLAPLAAGCCIQPFDEAGYHERFLPRETERFFWGFTHDPQARIRIQRLVNQGDTDGPENWETIAEVRPEPGTLSGFAGLEYYTWFCKLPLDNPRWWHCERFYLHSVDPIRVSGNDYSMKVRIVDEEGRLLFTYRYPPSISELVHTNPIDLWHNKGNPKNHLLLQLFRHGEASDGWAGWTNDGRIFH